MVIRQIMVTDRVMTIHLAMVATEVVVLDITDGSNFVFAI